MRVWRAYFMTYLLFIISSILLQAAFW